MAGGDYVVRLVNGRPTQVAVEDNLFTYSNNASAVAVGNVVYQSSSVDTFVDLADADDSNKTPPIGIVSEVVDTTSCIVTTNGGVVTGLTGLTRGAVYWLDTTAGQMTATEPSRNAYMVGIALSATTLLVILSPRSSVMSDQTETEVLGTALSPQAFSSADTYYDQSGSTDCLDYQNAVWGIYITTKGTATKVTVKVQWSLDNTNFDHQSVESISGGTVTVTDGEFEFSLTGETATFVKHLPLPTYGRRYAKVSAKVDTGTTTQGYVTVMRGA